MSFTPRSSDERSPAPPAAPTPTPTDFFLSSSSTSAPNLSIHVAEQAYRGAGFTGSHLWHLGRDQTNPVDVERELLLWELERQQIRSEILAQEIARRRVLEDEVRRELRLERDLALRRLEDFYATPVDLRFGIPLSGVFDGSSRPFDARSLPPNLPPPRSDVVGFQDPEPLATWGPNVNLNLHDASPPSSKDTIALAQPSFNLSTLKRKAVESDLGDMNASSEKKLKKNWSCALCQVSSTSEKGLMEHLQGRRHKAKGSGIAGTDPDPVDKKCSINVIENIKELEGTTAPMHDCEKKPSDVCGETTTTVAADENQNGMGTLEVEPELMLNGIEHSSLNSKKTFETPRKKCKNSNVELSDASGNSGGVVAEENQSGTGFSIGESEMVLSGNECSPPLNLKEIVETPLNAQVPLPTSKNGGSQKIFKFWCEMCSVGTHSEKVMGDHEKGKKHLAKLQALGKDKPKTTLRSVALPRICFVWKSEIGPDLEMDTVGEEGGKLHEGYVMAVEEKVDGGSYTGD